MYNCPACCHGEDMKASAEQQQQQRADRPAWRQVIELSCAEGVPCAHTSMVGFQTTTAALADLRAARKARRRVSPAKIAIGGIAILGKQIALTPSLLPCLRCLVSHASPSGRSAWSLVCPVEAALVCTGLTAKCRQETVCSAAGGATAALAFGDIVATGSNVPIEAVANGVSDIFTDMSGCCGGGCGDCCDCLGGCFGDLGACLGSCFDGIGDCFSGMICC